MGLLYDTCDHPDELCEERGKGKCFCICTNMLKFHKSLTLRNQGSSIKRFEQKEITSRVNTKNGTWVLADPSGEAHKKNTRTLLSYKKD